MAHPLSAAEANRTFSAVLRRVRDGESVVITSHGRPVARMVPVRDGDRVISTARATLFERLKGGRVTHADAWTRDDLHER